MFKYLILTMLSFMFSLSLAAKPQVKKGACQGLVKHIGKEFKKKCAQPLEIHNCLMDETCTFASGIEIPSDEDERSYEQAANESILGECFNKLSSVKRYKKLKCTIKGSLDYEDFMPR
jgi:hypothetical protein